MKLSLVVPCLNEQDNVMLFYQTALQELGGMDCDLEFVFIDDGSGDQTLPNLKRLYRQDPARIQIISFSRNFGKESAIYAGLCHASGDFITLIDADLQQPLSVVRQMVELLLTQPEYDCIAAYQGNRQENRMQAFCKKCFYWVINHLSDIEFMQGASDFRTFRRCVADAVIQMSEYHRFSKGLLSWVGFRTQYIPYQVQARHSGNTKWTFFKLMRYAFDGIIAFSTAPLKMAGIFGGLSAFAALVYLIVVLVQKLCFGIAVSGYATIVVLILFFGGVQLITLGIIGEYLARTYVQSKRRPIYIARETIGTQKTSEQDS